MTIRGRLLLLAAAMLVPCLLLVAAGAYFGIFVAVPADSALEPALATLRGQLPIALMISLAAGAVAWWAARGVSQPIRELRQALNALAQGKLSHRVALDAGGEVGDLAADVNRIAEELEEAEGRLRRLAAMSSDWIWETDAQHRFVYLSSGLERTLNVAADEVIGKTLWEVGILNLSESDWDAHRAVLEARQPFNAMRFEQRNRAGRLTYQSISGGPVFDASGVFVGYRGVGHDVTAQVEAERALRAERDRLSHVLETMAEGLSILDSRGRYVLINAAAERIIGGRREDVIGRHFRDVPCKRLPLGSDRESMPEETFERLRAGAQKDFGPAAYVLERADGTQRIVSHHSVRLEDQSGRFAGVVATYEDITDRVRTEGRNRLFLARALDGYWMVDMEGRILEVNHALCELLGYREEELLGMSSLELAAGRAPDEVRERLEEVRVNGFARYETQGRRKDGSLVEVEASATYLPIEGGRVCVFYRDITGRKRAEQILAESQARKSAILEASMDAVISIDHRGCVLEFNTAAEKQFGYARQDVIGREIAELIIPPELREAHRKGLQHYLATGEAKVLEKRLELPALRADGGRFDIELAIVRIPGSEPPLFTATLRDISGRKRAEQSLAEQRRQIEELNVDLERRVEERTAALTAAYQEMESFSYSVSHDLRAPLRAISGFSHILLEDFRGEIPAEAQRLLTRMAQNAERLGALIDGLLEFGRLARQPLRLQRIVPADVVREVLEEQAPAREGREVDLRVGDMPECRADRVLLKQVYANLVSNALKFTRARKRARIEVGAITMGLGPVYYVRDNGAGFDMAYARKLFHMFERLHSPTEFEGNGVGLALVRRIIERHGGEVWADSALNRGATFFFRLGDELAAQRLAGDKAA